LIFDEVKGGSLATAWLIATYGGTSGKKWAFLAGITRQKKQEPSWGY
jgi:hypothetical protein